MEKKRVFGLITIVVAIAMIIFGIFREEVTDVYNKAIRICLECIGIG